ncbi:MAG: UdgX family uracil-DNA binding protein [Brevundimonas sp.]|uniref:UdgX family uracil-DNA binding protein n=1 Tax=Brevundimonas sp. TaxID=1871086 RepID=UPI00391ADF60
MRVAPLAGETDFDGWRKAARAFRQAGVPPERAAFRVGTGGERLFDEGLPPPAPNAAPFSVSRAFVDLAQEVVLHRSEDRFDLMYRLLWRLGAEPDLIKIVTDVDVADALERAKNVSRASHKMKAFVRFRRTEDEAGERWVAWFEPAHRVLEKTAPFFMRRFATLRWSILTPDGSAFWDGESLTFGPPATPDMAPSEDEIEEFWKTYYASTFNPARLKTKAMQGEMPKRYWKNLPEAALISGLVAQSAVRTEAMVATPAAEPNIRLAKTLSRINRDRSFDEGFVPSSLEELGLAVQGCRRCPLWRDATQGVCGEGPRQAGLMIVGEQPGDQEDLAGRPFVGPAGGVLDAALEEAGIDREDVFVTNAVKHFKHEPRGKRRLHKTPSTPEVSACRWWLDAERRLVKPKVIVTLGATAALGVLGRKVAVTKERGQGIDLVDRTKAFLTVHPSYLLRIPEEAARAQERELFVGDLKRAKALL